MAKDRDTTPAPAQGAGKPAAASSRPEIDAFVARARTRAPPLEAGQRGRLIFALDATMSRQPTWDAACQLQGEMFGEAAAIGGLEVQLVYYRGFNECRASGWVADAKRLAGLMTAIGCRGGRTQIGKILAHARREAEKAKAQVLVFVGDAMEEEVDDLAAAAGELGLRGLRAFMFQEGNDPVAERAFREIARLTHGAYCRFDVGAAHQLRELLRAAAAFAAGGMRALSGRQGAGAQALLQQLK
jgi:hypothetical protein